MDSKIISDRLNFQQISSPANPAQVESSGKETFTDLFYSVYCSNGSLLLFVTTAVLDVAWMTISWVCFPIALFIIAKNGHFPTWPLLKRLVNHYQGPPSKTMMPVTKADIYSQQMEQPEIKISPKKTETKSENSDKDMFKTDDSSTRIQAWQGSLKLESKEVNTNVQSLKVDTKPPQENKPISRTNSPAKKVLSPKVQEKNVEAMREIAIDLNKLIKNEIFIDNKKLREFLSLTFSNNSNQFPGNCKANILSVVWSCYEKKFSVKVDDAAQVEVISLISEIVYKRLMGKYEEEKLGNGEKMTAEKFLKFIEDCVNHVNITVDNSLPKTGDPNRNVFVSDPIACSVDGNGVCIWVNVPVPELKPKEVFRSENNKKNYVKENKNKQGNGNAVYARGIFSSNRDVSTPSFSHRRTKSEVGKSPKDLLPNEFKIPTSVGGIRKKSEKPENLPPQLKTKNIFADENKSPNEVKQGFMKNFGTKVKKFTNLVKNRTRSADISSPGILLPCRKTIQTVESNINSANTPPVIKTCNDVRNRSRIVEFCSVPDQETIQIVKSNINSADKKKQTKNQTNKQERSPLMSILNKTECGR